MAKKSSSFSYKRTNIILSQSTPFAVAEAYKAARTNLMFKLNSKEKNTLIVTSSDAYEGKTTTCVNLAITFAQTGSKVLLIDADLRKPFVHKLLDAPLVPGLTDHIAGLTEDTPIRPTSYENLYLLPAGTVPPNPSELLMSDSMAKFINQASEDFDYVFIDTPPVGVVTDASVLAPKTTGALVVARQNYSTKDAVKSAIASLESAGANVLGFIFNDVNLDSRSKKKGKHSYYYSDK